MTNTAIQRTGNEESRAVALPEPRVSISIRQAEQSDLAFVDALQKEHSKMVGWFPTKQLETNIAKGQVAIAETASEQVGYCISNDRYFKRDDCGVIYQLNVAPTKQRGLIGASLVKHAFERAAYGCRLFCCWCAQDLEANYFWESLGFVPLAFRTGSRRAGRKKEPRIHIFWQRRIRENDDATPYWFPSETMGGAIRENRIVLPIPPGTHWSDAKPAVLPGMEKLNELPPAEKRPRGERSRSKKRKKDEAAKRPTNGLWFAPPEPSAEEKKAAKAEARKANKKPTARNDPKLVAAARELRDRYMDEINEGRMLPPAACGKYEVSRQLEAAESCFDVVNASDGDEEIRVQPNEVRYLDAA